jgi:hypothetical protein
LLPSFLANSCCCSTVGEKCTCASVGLGRSILASELTEVHWQTESGMFKIPLNIWHSCIFVVYLHLLKSCFFMFLDLFTWFIYSLYGVTVGRLFTQG